MCYSTYNQDSAQSILKYRSRSSLILLLWQIIFIAAPEIPLISFVCVGVPITFCGLLSIPLHI